MSTLPPTFFRRRQRLGDIALVAMHGVHHELEGGINNGSGVFGIEVASEGSEAGQIGKERSDGLALAVGDPTGFQRRLLSPDALGKVLGGVANRSRV